MENTMLFRDFQQYYLEMRWSIHCMLSACKLHAVGKIIKKNISVISLGGLGCETLCCMTVSLNS